jgi:hypothetical protein
MYSGNTLYYGILIDYLDLLSVNWIEDITNTNHDEYIKNIDDMLSNNYVWIGLYRKPCCSFNIKEDKLILGVELDTLEAQNRTCIKKYKSILDYHTYFLEQINKVKIKYQMNEKLIKKEFEQVFKTFPQLKKLIDIKYEFITFPNDCENCI